MNPLLEKVVFAGGGALVSLVGALYAVGMKLSRMEGAMDHLVGIAKEFHDEKINRVLLKQEVQKAQTDVNAAHVAIRELKKTTRR